MSPEADLEVTVAEPVDRTLKLKVPVQFGSERIEELNFKPSARHFRGFQLPMKGDGTILFEPYELAKVGVHMAGHPNAVVDLLDPEDMFDIAQRALCFFAPSLATGGTP